MKKNEILAKQEEYLWPNHLLYYTDPLPLDYGDGLYVWDVEGNKYLDFFAGILTNSVGHNHPLVVEKMREQIRKLVHTSTLYPHENHVTLAEKIASIAPGELQTSFFTNSGTEANETAIMLAKAYTGEQEIIALRHGYSGRSALAMGLIGQSEWRVGPSQIPGINHAISPYCYRCPLKMTYPECGVACAEDIEDLIKTTTSGRIAGFMVEPIQGVGGFITPPKEYFKIASEIVKHYGGLFICDEVQTGFGRTGQHWFGIEHWGVEPDIMTMAKGIAGGMPMGNTITTLEIAAELVGKGMTISTFGGNPVSCAASLGTIEVMETEANPNHVKDVGSRLQSGLDRLWEKYPLIGDVRGKGLMQGIELVKDRKTKEPAPDAVAKIFEHTRMYGLLIGKGGLYSNVLRISPPLTATNEHVEEALVILDHAFAKVQEEF
ncbi:MAG: aspartate aminotransferase family protein [Anaerolineaceae bacterium]|nr:aspartate aminotransferase family protein [Anaerolineaceae bacterium]|tara:strand:+ start:64669 stop:65970 length:1302 start_codon:yes stop_codon:yes gene_type:complete